MKGPRFKRYGVSISAGSDSGRPYAVVDFHDKQGGKGARRVSFHPTAAEASRLNSEGGGAR